MKKLLEYKSLTRIENLKESRDLNPFLKKEDADEFLKILSSPLSGIDASRIDFTDFIDSRFVNIVEDYIYGEGKKNNDIRLKIGEIMNRYLKPKDSSTEDINLSKKDKDVVNYIIPKLNKLFKKLGNSELFNWSNKNNKKNTLSSDNLKSKYNISFETFEWLHNWMWDMNYLRKYQTEGLLKNDLIFKELEKFKRSGEYNLYRVVKSKDIKKEIELTKTQKLKSYFNDFRNAKMLCEDEGGGFVEILITDSKNILVDFSLLPEDVPELKGKMLNGASWELNNSETIVISEYIKDNY